MFSLRISSKYINFWEIKRKNKVVDCKNERVLRLSALTNNPTTSPVRIWAIEQVIGWNYFVKIPLNVINTAFTMIIWNWFLFSSFSTSPLDRCDEASAQREEDRQVAVAIGSRPKQKLKTRALRIHLESHFRYYLYHKLSDTLRNFGSYKRVSWLNSSRFSI